MIKKIHISGSQRLKNWRNKLCVSQPKAAKMLGVPLPTYRNWEQAVSRVHPLVWVLIEGMK